MSPLRKVYFADFSKTFALIVNALQIKKKSKKRLLGAGAHECSLHADMDSHL
jgi:hypothetical protein